MKGEFYKMDFRAWNIGTVDLTLEQEAAYLRLCHAMYDVGGPVPNSTRMLMGLFRCGNAKALALLGALIKAGKIAQTSDGRLFNHRVSEELQSREKVSAARRISGERGGSAPRVKPEWSPSDPRVTPECLSSDPRLPPSKPLKNKEQDEAIAPTLRSRGEEIREEKKEESSLRSLSRPIERRHAWPEDFREETWRRYGKPVEKKAGMAALENLFKADRTSYTEFIAGVDRQAVSVPDPQFRPSLERFIKREKWTDQPIPQETGNGSGPSARVTAFPSGGGYQRSSFPVVATAMANVRDKRGLGPRGGAGGDRPGDATDHAPGRDDPTFEDADWTPARGYCAAHH